MKYTTYKCDECGVLKNKVNHWWVVTHVPGLDGSISITPMPPDLPDGRITVCGRECAQKALERWMADITREIGRSIAVAEAAQAAARTVVRMPAQETVPDTASPEVGPSAAIQAPQPIDISSARESRRRGLKQAHPRTSAVAREGRRAS
jgi:hypothetical protein